MARYSIIMFFQEDHDEVLIDTGLTLNQAQAHCKDPETSSTTATSPEAQRRTEQYGAWFHGYREV